jgi:hypothetical protein
MGDDDQTKQINNLEKSIDPTVLVKKPKPVILKSRKKNLLMHHQNQAREIQTKRNSKGNSIESITYNTLF